MTTFLFLFHSTVGVVRMRKAMQAAGVAFEVKDIPRQLRSGCGLCILLEGTEADARGWIVPEQTAALYQQNGEAWRCLATFRPAGESLTTKRVAAKQFSRRCMRKTRVSVTTSETVTEVMRYRSLNTRS